MSITHKVFPSRFLSRASKITDPTLNVLRGMALAFQPAFVWDSPSACAHRQMALGCKLSLAKLEKLHLASLQQLLPFIKSSPFPTTSTPAPLAPVPRGRGMFLAPQTKDCAGICCCWHWLSPFCSRVGSLPGGSLPECARDPPPPFVAIPSPAPSFSICSAGEEV